MSVICGCKKNSDKDTVAPDITSISINGKLNEDTIEAGDSILIAATLKDDSALGSLCIETKGKHANANRNEFRTVEVSGNNQDISEVFVIHGNIKQGEYFV